MSDDLAAQLRGLGTHATHVAAKRIDEQAAEITRLRAEQGEVRGYLSRLLQSLHPSIEILPDLLGVCTQIDNVLAGQMEDITRLRAALATARREGMEEAAQIAERVGKLYGAGVAETVSDVIRAAAKKDRQP